jgi:hypothetical protein
MATPATDIAVHLDATIASLDFGVNLFEGPVAAVVEDDGFSAPIPPLAVFVKASGGRTRTNFVDGGQGTGLIRPSVEVWIRSDKHKYQDGEALGREIEQAIDKNPQGDWIDWHVPTSYPTHVDIDQEGHFYWIIPVDTVAKFDIVDAQKIDLYYGVAAAGQTGEAFILSLVNDKRFTRKIAFNVDAGLTDKIYYAAPESAGAPTFSVGGFVGGFFLAEDGVSVNGSPYDLWESDNVDLGVTTVTVT